MVAREIFIFLILIVAGAAAHNQSNIFSDPDDAGVLRVPPKDAEVLAKAYGGGRVNKGVLDDFEAGGRIFVSVKVRGEDPRGLKARGDIFERLKKSSEKAQMRVLSKLGTGDFILTHRMHTIPVFGGHVSREGLLRLLSDPNVESVEAPFEVTRHLPESGALVNATMAWNIRRGGANITGAGQTVCVIDSGINYGHPDFGGCGIEDIRAGECVKIPWGHDFADGDDDPMDTAAEGFHGSHVSGIIASSDATYRGISPDAKIVPMKVFHDSGGAFSTYVAAAIDACTANASQFNISVISMSIGISALGSCDPSDCDSPLGDGGVGLAIAAANAAGISVVASSGNDANTSKISFPACNRYALSVGGVYDYDGGGIDWGICTDDFAGVDGVICHTNRCEILDLFAPGFAITATNGGGSGHIIDGGTSMAAPHVSGAVALLKQWAWTVNGSALSPELVGQALEAGGVPVTRDVTKPRIDIYGSLRHLNFRPPSLRDGMVSPEEGNESTVFNFTVVYEYVEEDLEPEYVNVVIDGDAHPMSANQSSHREDVLYHYSANLSLGSHTHRFNASDGEYETVTDEVSLPEVRSDATGCQGALPNGGWTIDEDTSCTQTSVNNDGDLVIDAGKTLHLTNTTVYQNGTVTVEGNLVMEGSRIEFT